MKKGTKGYGLKIGKGHKVAIEIAKGLFEIEKPTLEMIQGVYSRAVWYDEDNDIMEDKTEEGASQLILAREWAHDELLGDNSPAATFYAWDQLFAEEVAEEDEEEDEEDEENEDEE